MTLDKNNTLPSGKPLPSDTCQANVRDGWHVYPCGKKAKMLHTNGRCYCGTHDPIRLKAKADERNAKWEAQREKDHAVRAAHEKLIADGRKYAALEPLLRELCEARGMAFGGEWERDGENIITDKPHSGWCIAKLHEQADCSDGDFIATAANITARIREVVEK